MRKIIRHLVLAFVFVIPFLGNTQQPQDIYRKPLKDVLEDVEKNYHVKLRYDDKNVKDLNVNYATWRFTSDLRNTLDNILKPLDLKYREIDKSTYEIIQYE